MGRSLATPMTGTPWPAGGCLRQRAGREAGRAAFLDEFAVPMAATTSGNDPATNFLMAHYLEYLRKQGEDIPVGHQFPATVGGRRVNVNIRDYKAMRERGGYQGLGEDQPKMHNFARSFIGDLSHGVMDEQMAGGAMGHLRTKARGKSGPTRRGTSALACWRSSCTGGGQEGACAGQLPGRGLGGLQEANSSGPMISHHQRRDRAHAPADWDAEGGDRPARSDQEGDSDLRADRSRNTLPVGWSAAGRGRQ